MRKRLALLFMLLGLVGAGLLPPTPAGAAPAAGTADVEFKIDTVLPTYPCPDGPCGAGLTGTGSGAGEVTGGTVPTTASFVVTNGSVSGSAGYVEASAPLCPIHGSAAGTVNFSAGFGQISGLVYQPTTSPFLTGTVTGVNASLVFNYQRVGATAEIVILGGSMRVSYALPTGPGSFDVPIVGGGGQGIFVADPVAVATRCLSPGSLAVSILGDVGVTFAST